MIRRPRRVLAYLEAAVFERDDFDAVVQILANLLCVDRNRGRDLFAAKMQNPIEIGTRTPIQVQKNIP